MKLNCADCQKSAECPKSTTPESAECLKMLGFRTDNPGTANRSETAKDNKELIAYLGDAIKLERNLFTQECIHLNFLEIASERGPRLQLLPEPARPDRNSVGYQKFSMNNGKGMLLFILSFVAVVCFIAAKVHSGSYMPSQSFIVGSVVVGILCLAAGILPNLLSYLKTKENNKRAGETESRQMREYQKALSETKERNSAITAQYNKDKANWDASCSRTTAFMDKKHDETEAARVKLYSRNLIHPKYQNLLALTSIYDYLTTGRCSELTGPHGAYNLYEEETRQNLIISKLDAIHYDLQQIKQNQFMLQRQLNEVNREMSIIRSDLSKIKTYTFEIAYFTELNAYYNQITTDNTAFIAAYSI